MQAWRPELSEKFQSRRNKASPREIKSPQCAKNGVLGFEDYRVGSVGTACILISWAECQIFLFKDLLFKYKNWGFSWENDCTLRLEVT